MKKFLKIALQIIIIDSIVEFVKGFIRGWKESNEERR